MAHQSYETRASIFLKLNASEGKPREIAWQTFHQRYAPIIAGFARNLGVPPQDIDDIVQDVLLGFYKASPNYQYDPAKGRFRGYLKVCTLNAIRAKVTKTATGKKISLDDLDPASAAVEDRWNETWDKELMDRAINEARADYRNNKTFQAFELYAVKGKSPEGVAKEVGMSVDGVYQAKKRVTDAIRLKVKALEE